MGMVKQPADKKDPGKNSDSYSGFDKVAVNTIGLSSDGRIVYINQSACEWLGFSQKELIGNPFESIAPDMTPGRWSGLWSEVDSLGYVENKTALRIRRSNKEEVQVRYRGFRVLKSEQKGCVLFMTRPDETPKAVFNVTAQRAQLVQILDSIGNPVISIDAQFKITFLNKNACEAFGTTLGQAVGKPIHDNLSRDDADRLREKLQAVMESGRPETCTWPGIFFKSRHGQAATLLPYFDESSNQKRVLAVINLAGASADLPSSEIGHASLPANNNHAERKVSLSNQFEKNAVGLFLKNTENRYLWMNQAFAAMLGCECKELIGKRVDDVVRNPEAMRVLRDEDDYVYATGQPLFNLKRRPPLPYLVSHRVDKFPFFGPEKQVEGIIGLVVRTDLPPHADEAYEEKVVSVSRKLEETETALRVLIENSQRQVSQGREAQGEKIKSLVVPYLENLKQTPLTSDQLEYVKLIEDNLKNFYDPTYAKLSAPEYKLSPTELKVARLVRDGKTNKEIAQLLHLSKSTILTHRHHIRVKLGIRNKKINLRSLLKS
jgi:PAS domain S-box-containing protein